MKQKSNKRGFTIIELLVIMAIIGVLVGLSVPKFKGFTERAKKTEILSNINELEKASERYYIEYGEWPRISDTPYTPEQIEEYSNEIYKKTGLSLQLENDAKYYDIDYKKLGKYISKPSNQFRYLLQNPVGEVIYMDGLTPKGQQHISDKIKNNDDNPDNNNPDNPDNQTPNNPKVIFEDVDPGITDNNPDTQSCFGGDGSYSTKEITWKGNLDNKGLNINITSTKLPNTLYHSSSLHFIDASGKKLSFLNLTNKTYTTGLSFVNSTVNNLLVVPKGAVKIRLEMQNVNVCVNDIIQQEDNVSPKEVSNITSNVGTHKSLLTWNNPSDVDFDKVALFKDNILIDIFNVEEYLDKPLLSSYKYNYELQALDTSGNASEKLSHEIITSQDKVIFYNIDAGGQDEDPSTKFTFASGTGPAVWREVTYSGDLMGKVLYIDTNVVGSQAQLSFRDDKGNTLKHLNLKTGVYTTVTSLVGNPNLSILVPDGTKTIIFSTWSATVNLIDMYVDDLNFDRPNTITNTNSTVTNYSATLNWTNPNNTDFQKVAIYRDDVLIAFVNGTTYTDKPLYSNKSYKYEIQAIDNVGNASLKTVHNITTSMADVVFGQTPFEAGAFDKDPTTKHSFIAGSGPGTNIGLTWTGNLVGKALYIDYKVTSGSQIGISFKNISGTIINSVNLNTSTQTTVHSMAGNTKIALLVPDGATSMQFSSWSTITDIFDIYIDNNIVPSPVSNVWSSATDYTVSLNWTNPNDKDFGKVAIFRNGTFLGFTTGTTYVDKPLYSNEVYNYELKTINTNGNASQSITHTRATSAASVVFAKNIFGAGAFDKDPTTKHNFSSGSGSAEYRYLGYTGDLIGKKLRFDYKIISGGNVDIRFKDATNKDIPFLNITTGATVTSTNLIGYNSMSLLVPAGTKNIMIGTWSTSVDLFDMYVVD